ncbi:MAG: cyanophycinase [Bacteroidota bacterium]
MRTPKGRIMIIGGAEEREGRPVPEMAEENEDSVPFSILKELLPPSQSKKPVKVFLTALKDPEDAGKTYKETFSRLGFHNVEIINISSREQASDPGLIKDVVASHAVFFSGGNQFRLTTILGGTEIASVIEKKYYEDESFILAGTSAGAMAMSKVMIYQGQPKEAMLQGEMRFMSGLGFLDNCIIDTHFVKRSRFGRLTQTILQNPTCVGIGLGEDTALVVSKGNVMECIGSGMVIIIDGSQIKYTNILSADLDSPLSVEGLVVHILAKGNGYKLREKEYIPEVK